MTITVARPVESDPLSRVEAFLAAHDSAVEELVPGTGLLASDLLALTAAARAIVDLELENAQLREVAAPKVRTGQLLAATRRDRDLMRDTLVEVEELAARHHRGDPYGVQGAAAQQILDVLAEGPTAGLRADIAATALESAAQALAEHELPATTPVTWLLQRAAEVRSGTQRG